MNQEVKAQIIRVIRRVARESSVRLHDVFIERASSALVDEVFIPPPAPDEEL